MSIDLETNEGRKKYLIDKLDDLLEGINESYGKLLLDELILRLEITVKDFNEEMKILIDQLVKKEKERQQILKMMKGTKNTLENMNAPIQEEISKTAKIKSVEIPDEVELTEWEKKLEKIEKGD